MSKVVGIKFNGNPKLYFFEPANYEYTENAPVVVETSRGLEYGTVAMLPAEVEAGKIVQPLKPIVRLATLEDARVYEKLQEKRELALPQVLDKIEKRKLNMKLVNVEFTFDNSKLIVYFTADGRIDFRDLVRDLASIFHMRIELRQIGARDECRMLGGIAPCGRACCCSDHMSDFAKVSIKMAKNQNLSLNPVKISGLCGRLMCCLAYENSNYVDMNRKMPKYGSIITMNDEKTGVVVGLNQLKESVRVKIENKDSFDFVDYPLKDIKDKGKGSALDDLGMDDKADLELKNLLD